MLGFDPWEPFRYGFFERGLVVAAITGALCGLVGVYVVLRSMSYIGHGLSHAVFGGAAISAVMGTSYFLGAGLWGVLAGLIIGRVSSRSTVGADAAIGVVTTASFAIGQQRIQPRPLNAQEKYRPLKTQIVHTPPLGNEDLLTEAIHDLQRVFYRIQPVDDRFGHRGATRSSA